MSTTDAKPKVAPIIPPADDKKPRPAPKAEKPPKQEVPKPSGPGTTATASGKPTKFHRELAEFMSVPALLFELKGDHYVAYIYNKRITKHAYASADLADKNPALKRKLQALMEGGAYGQVVITGLAVIIAILAYYGVYPQGMLNP